MRSCVREFGRLVALLAVIGEKSHRDGLEIGRNALLIFARTPDSMEGDRRSDLAGQTSSKPVESEELPEHDPDRVQIGPAIEPFTPCLLGRQVAARA